MTNYEKFKNKSVEEMAELKNEAFMIWKSEQLHEVFGKMNETQMRAVKQHHHNYFHELLRREVE